MQFIQANLTKQHLINSLKCFSPELQTKLVATILTLQGDDANTTSVSQESLINLLSRFLADGKIQNPVLENLPQLQLNALKELNQFVSNKSDKDESFFKIGLMKKKGNNSSKGLRRLTSCITC
ncbi:MAG: hypothetical protein JST87_00145 [Bacteroidetes bacterium]|nr:hypothetical protein [Bacteroidota bacterium]